MNVNWFVYPCLQCLIFVISVAILTSSRATECNRCKILSDSFNYWLQKTARGKHEGGDAAWEEARLKSYSRSEMRLIEIQESLCTDVKRHQDQCYGFVEESEHLLEQWWVREDPNSQDLFKWLCINTLELCCPKNHYGSVCTFCPVDDHSKVCGDRGKCDGDGTREGNGSCICDEGYSGELCKNCAQNYYSLNYGICQQCHNSCNGCVGQGPDACQFCKIGWKLESGVCIDINECLSSNICKSHQFCVNLEGSFSCKNCDDLCKTCYGKRNGNCTSCFSNYLLWDGMCLNETLKYELISVVLKRVALYLFLFIISILICLKIKPLVSLVILLLGLLIYFIEKETKFNIISVYYLLYGNQT